MASVPVFANSDFNITGSDLIELCIDISIIRGRYRIFLRGGKSGREVP